MDDATPRLAGRCDCDWLGDGTLNLRCGCDTGHEVRPYREDVVHRRNRHWRLTCWAVQLESEAAA